MPTMDGLEFVRRLRAVENAKNVPVIMITTMVKVQQLEAELAGLPEVRQEKIQPLQQAVQEGRYQVSDEQLAQAIFADLLAPTLLR